MNEGTTPETGTALAGRDSSELLSCPRCKRDDRLRRESWNEGYCCISCKCGYVGPLAEFGEEAEHLWNGLAR
jgi:hypothetical protein